MDQNTESSSDDNMDMIDEYVAHIAQESPSRSDQTPKRRREILTKLQRDLPHGLDHTCREELEEWLRAPNARTGKPRSQNTNVTYLNAIRSAYRFWADPADPWINEDPTVGIPSIARPKARCRAASEEQLAWLLEHGVEPYRTWTVIAAYQGLRCIELSGLDREHITERQLVVVRGKGGKARAQDTDPLVWETVRNLPPGPVCRDMWGRERATAYYISAMASRYYQSVGFDGLTMHMWRHRLGKQVQRLYKDIRVTQEMLGHDSLTSTQIYTDVDEDQTRAARSMLPRPSAARG